MPQSHSDVQLAIFTDLFEQIREQIALNFRLPTAIATKCRPQNDQLRERDDSGKIIRIGRGQ